MCGGDSSRRAFRGPSFSKKMQPQPATRSRDFGMICVRREDGFRLNSRRTLGYEEGNDMCEFNKLVELGDRELEQVRGGGSGLGAETSDFITPDALPITARLVRAPKDPPRPGA
jgi:hypothetical protein